MNGEQGRAGVTAAEGGREEPTAERREIRAHWLAALSLLGVLLLAILVYHPFADLNYGVDDFAYAWSAQRLFYDGKLVASSWVAAAAVPQVVWGAAFCKVFGFSWRMLNVSTMVAAAFGPPLIYWLAVELGISRRHAIALVFFAIVNPLYLGFATSFMSDAYYAVLLLGAALAYARGLSRRRTWLLVVASLIASVALLQRQIGIATPAAVVVTLAIAVLTKRRTLRESFVQALAAGLAPALSALIFRTFPDSFGGTTPTQLVKLNSHALLTRLLDVPHSISDGYTTLVYIAALLVPLLIAFLPAYGRSLSALRSWPARVMAGAFLALSLVGLGFAYRGTLHLTVGGEFFQTFPIPRHAVIVWQVLAVLGALTLPLLAAVFLVQIKAWLRREPGFETRLPTPTPADDVVLTRVFVAATLVLHVLLVSTFISFFNNYFLPLIPLALLVAGTVLPAPEPEKAWRVWWLPGLAAAGMFVYSTLSMDVIFRYVEANDRWVQEVLASGTRSDQVFDYDGSFGRRNYDMLDREIAKSPWGAFPAARRKSKLLLVSAERPLYGGFTRVVESRSYRTLSGEYAIELRVRPPRARRPRRPAPSPAPSEPASSAPAPSSPAPAASESEAEPPAE